MHITVKNFYGYARQPSLKTVESEIIEKFGYIRGTDFTPEKGEEIIRGVMRAHNLYSEAAGEGEENEDESGDKNVKAGSFPGPAKTLQIAALLFKPTLFPLT
jgi:hypothetical protein